MKNRLLTLAGGVALLAVLGKYYAIPAIAQAVRAALVSNVDDPGRIPYEVTTSFGFGGGNGGSETPRVPAGKRLVITNVSGTVDTNLPGGSLLQPTIGVSGHLHTISPSLIFSGSGNGENSFAFNQPTLLFVDAGDFMRVTITIAVVPTQGFLSCTLSGYLLDCSTGPCAANAPF